MTDSNTSTSLPPLSEDQLFVQWHRPVKLKHGADLGWDVSVLEESFSIVHPSIVRRVVRTIPSLVSVAQAGLRGALGANACRVDVFSKMTTTGGKAVVKTFDRPLLFCERGLLHVG